MWTEEEINLLKEHYPSKGVSYCAELLNRSKSSVKGKVHGLKIKLKSEYRSKINTNNVLKKQILRDDNTFKVNPNKFYNIKDPEVSYYLGLFWSDGYLHNNGLNIYCSYDDIEVIKELLNRIGEWSYYNIPAKKPGRKDITRVYTYNTRISNFMKENGFNLKSTDSPCKIIKKIPISLRHYFFRGLVDGDGCFYYKKTKNVISNRQFSITSSYNQKWYYVTELLDSLNVKYTIRRINSKKGSYSQIRVTKKSDIIKIGNYMYQGEFFGYTRKFNKFKELSK